jgi:hypothetical protein
MLEGIRCRIKFYFLLSLFFMPVAMGEWRSRVIAASDGPLATDPDPRLTAIVQAQEEADAAQEAAAADTQPPTRQGNSIASLGRSDSLDQDQP